jgi:hypothetical protein
MMMEPTRQLLQQEQCAMAAQSALDQDHPHPHENSNEFSYLSSCGCNPSLTAVMAMEEFYTKAMSIIAMAAVTVGADSPTPTPEHGVVVGVKGNGNSRDINMEDAFHSKGRDTTCQIESHKTRETHSHEAPLVTSASSGSLEGAGMVMFQKLCASSTMGDDNHNNTQSANKSADMEESEEECQTLLNYDSKSMESSSMAHIADKSIILDPSGQKQSNSTMTEAASFSRDEEHLPYAIATTASQASIINTNESTIPASRSDLTIVSMTKLQPSTVKSANNTSLPEDGAKESEEREEKNTLDKNELKEMSICKAISYSANSTATSIISTNPPTKIESQDLENGPFLSSSRHPQQILENCLSSSSSSTQQQTLVVAETVGEDAVGATVSVCEDESEEAILCDTHNASKEEVTSNTSAIRVETVHHCAFTRDGPNEENEEVLIPCQESLTEQADLLLEDDAETVGEDAVGATVSVCEDESEDAILCDEHNASKEEVTSSTPAIRVETVHHCAFTQDGPDEEYEEVLIPRQESLKEQVELLLGDEPLIMSVVDAVPGVSVSVTGDDLDKGQKIDQSSKDVEEVLIPRQESLTEQVELLLEDEPLILTLHSDPMPLHPSSSNIRTMSGVDAVIEIPVSVTGDNYLDTDREINDVNEEFEVLNPHQESVIEQAAVPLKDMILLPSQSDLMLLNPSTRIMPAVDTVIETVSVTGDDDLDTDREINEVNEEVEVLITRQESVMDLEAVLIEEESLMLSQSEAMLVNPSSRIMSAVDTVIEIPISETGDDDLDTDREINEVNEEVEVLITRQESVMDLEAVLLEEESLILSQSDAMLVIPSSRIMSAVDTVIEIPISETGDDDLDTDREINEVNEEVEVLITRQESVTDLEAMLLEDESLISSQSDLMSIEISISRIMSAVDAVIEMSVSVAGDAGLDEDKDTNEPDKENEVVSIPRRESVMEQAASLLEDKRSPTVQSVPIPLKPLSRLSTMSVVDAVPGISVSVTGDLDTDQEIDQSEVFIPFHESVMEQAVLLLEDKPMLTSPQPDPMPLNPSDTMSLVDSETEIPFSVTALDDLDKDQEIDQVPNLKNEDSLESDIICSTIDASEGQDCQKPQSQQQDSRLQRHNHNKGVVKDWCSDKPAMVFIVVAIAMRIAFSVEL